LTFQDILLSRLILFGDPDICTEQRVTEKAVSMLSACNETAGLNSDSRLQYHIFNAAKSKITVCGRYWAAVFGLCESKMIKVRLMVKNHSKIAVHASTGVLHKPVVLKKTIVCHSFWTHFFNENCQKPTDSIRLFPVNKPFLVIYEEFFTPWFTKLHNSTKSSNDEAPWMPSFHTFKKARYHSDFSDVKNRPRHYHARCKDCDELNAIRLRGFVNNEQKLGFDIAFKAHQAEARCWHEHEEAAKHESRRNGGRDSVVIGYDDTSCLELPKFTNRDVKGLTKSRLQIIPFNITNYTSGESAYVYTLKGRYPKGANRLCTVLYHYLRKMKFGTHPCRFARKLYLHADNYSENKNNCVFMFASELVQRGWFDVIYLEFGPPGHTHNGTDAVHRIHNKVAGDCTSLTLGQFQRQWKKSWRKDFTMPTGVINDAHLDFVSYYKPFQERVAGFTNTPDDPKSVKAFKFQWSRRETRVEMLWKPNADNTDHWLGADSTLDSPGFFVLDEMPRGRPLVTPPARKVMKSKYIKEICSKPMKKQFTAHVNRQQASDSIDWLRKTAESCKIPFDLVEENKENGNATDILRSDWGPAVKVGVPGLEGDFFLMQDNEFNDCEEFWKLPTDIQVLVDEETVFALQARRDLEGLPLMRYERPAANVGYIPDKRTKKRQRDEIDPERTGAAALASILSASDDEYLNKEPEEKEVSEEEEGKEIPAGRYGPTFDTCKSNWIAVAYRKFDDGGIGLELYKVGTLHPATPGTEEDDYFTASAVYRPGVEGLLVTDPSCLRKRWDAVPKSRGAAEKVYGWEVLTYLKKLNKKGRSGWMISSKDQTEILTIGEDRKLVLFQDPPDERHPAPLNFVHSEDDDRSESDADHDESEDEDSDACLRISTAEDDMSGEESA
jgi:hypothetical protein